MKATASALAGAFLAALALAGCGGGGGTPYSFAVPAHWKQRTPTPHGLVAVYVREGGAALLTIRADAGTIVVSKRFVRSLDAQFRKRLAGYVPLTHKIVVTKAGPAFYFSYTQKQGGRLTSILLVPAHGKSYVLDAVSNPRLKAATHDIGTIFHTFVPH